MTHPHIVHAEARGAEEKPETLRKREAVASRLREVAATAGVVRGRASAYFLVALKGDRLPISSTLPSIFAPAASSFPVCISVMATGC